MSLRLHLLLFRTRLQSADGALFKEVVANTSENVNQLSDILINIIKQQIIYLCTLGTVFVLYKNNGVNEQNVHIGTSGENCVGIWVIRIYLIFQFQSKIVLLLYTIQGFNLI